MIRRHAVAILAMLAMGLVVSARAEAGATGGAVGVKKTANVIIKNNTSNPYYVLVVPSALAESTKFGTPNTVGWARKLGAVLVNPGKQVTYPVPAGVGGIGVYAPGDYIKNPAASLPDPDATGGYEVAKGKKVTKTINADSGTPPVITID